MNEFAMVNSNPSTPVAMDDDNNFITDLTAPAKACYCSVVANDEKSRKALFNATNNPDFRLAAYVNKPIKVKDVFVEVVPCTNKETGEVRECPRIVLIDEKNKSYTCVSVGVFSALKKLFAIFGTPDAWDKPIEVTPVTVQKDKFSILTLNI